MMILNYNRYMNKFFIILLFLFTFVNSAFSAPGYIPIANPEWALISANKVKFTPKGRIISFNGHKIGYKNDKIAHIDNKYATYLHGELYTIGGEKLEKDNTCITKIGDKSIFEYFTGKKDSEYLEYYDNIKDTFYVTMHVYKDGSIGCSISNGFIFFEGTEVSKPAEAKPVYNSFFTRGSYRISRIGNDNITYWSNGKINKIGDKIVNYTGDKIWTIGGKSVHYNQRNEIDQIGDERVKYDSNGSLWYIGNKKAWNDSNGRMIQLGDKNVFYEKIGY